MKITFVETSVAAGSKRLLSVVGRENLGGQLVAACVEQAGHEVQYLALGAELGAEEIAREAIEAGGDVTVFFPYTFTADVTARAAKLVRKNCTVVMGGYHFGMSQFHAEEALAEGFADYVIMGRGDSALPELLEKLPSPPPIVSGEATAPFAELPRPIRRFDLAQDLSVNPLPFHPAHVVPNPTHLYVVAGAIGCSGRCDFCLSHKICNRPLHREPSDVVDEMAAIAAMNKKCGGGDVAFHFANPLFNASHEWVLELCRLMAKYGPFASVAMPDARGIDEEMVGAMKSAGFFLSMLGMEFVSDSVREGRGKRPGSMENAFRLFQEAGILTRAFYMIGRLGMTAADLEQEIRAIESLPFRADQLRPSFETPFPGTECWDNLNPGDVSQVDFSHWTIEEPVYQTPHSSAEWLRMRDSMIHRYHRSDAQVSHYDRMVTNHPELEGPIEGFLQNQ